MRTANTGCPGLIGDTTGPVRPVVTGHKEQPVNSQDVALTVELTDC